MKNKWKIFLIELFFFAATLILAAFVSVRLSHIFQTVEASTEGEEFATPLTFIVYFFAATILVYLVSKSERLKNKRILFFKITFFFSVFLGGFLTISAVTYELFALVLIAMLLLAWRKKPVIFLHNILVVLSIAGVGSIIGMQFKPVVIAVFLAIFSVYDFIAVYKTRHMVKMASEMIKTRAIMGIIVPFSFSDLFANLEKKRKKEFMVLGGGDLAFPSFLVASVVLEVGIFEGFFVTLFSCLGLLGSFLLFDSQKKKKAIPALPPIALGSLIGYLLVII